MRNRRPLTLGIALLGAWTAAGYEVSALAQPVVAVFRIQDTRPKRSRMAPNTLENLSDYLSTLLAEGGDFKVVPKSGITSALSDLKRASYRQCYDERCQIEVGKAVAAEKLISTKIIRVGKRCIVATSMFNVREEATEKAASHKGRCDEGAVTEGLEQVAAQLRDHHVRRARGDRDVGARPDVWNPKARGKRVIANFRSDPPGAVVLLDGELLCQDTSSGCSRTVTQGKHRVSMQKERYETKEASVYIRDNAQIDWRLVANFGQVTVDSDPPGLPVRIAGEVMGKTPLEGLELEPGEHRIMIDDPCYFEAGMVISINRDQTKRVSLKVYPKEGALDVVAEDRQGNATRAEIIVDGVELGVTPQTVKVPVCAQELIVQNDAGSFRQRLDVQERSVQKIEAVLSTRGRASSRRNRNNRKNRRNRKKAKAPVDYQLLLGVQGFYGLICPQRDADGNCVGNYQGGGGGVRAEWPPSFFLRGAARVGVAVYGRTGSARIISVPATASLMYVGELSKKRGALGLLASVDASYVFRTFSGDGAQGDLSNHNFEVGGSLGTRFSGYELGGGIYVPVVGSGKGIVARLWLGLNFGILGKPAKPAKPAESASR